MSFLVIRDCGPGLSIQDHGRFGWRRFGISTAGAMDRQHLAIANRLVGNPTNAAAIETVLSGCRLEVVGPPVLLAAAGPGVSLFVDGRPVPASQSSEVEEGQVVTLSPAREGVYGYLAVAGGFDLVAEMGSLSAHLRSGVGQPRLCSGANLPVRVRQGRGLRVPLALSALPPTVSGPIRILWGPQEDWFDTVAREQLVANHWTISQRSDRMGMFLDGPALAQNAGSMVSDGVLPGSIQVPPSGTPVVLMRDCQTTGGYPKIATVISADLDRLAQIRPGQTLRFRAVSRHEALTALRNARADIDALHPKPAVRAPNTARLMQVNLIDGVWSDYPVTPDAMT